MKTWNTRQGALTSQDSQPIDGAIGMKARSQRRAAIPAIVDKEVVTVPRLVDEIDANHLTLMVTTRNVAGTLKHIAERINRYDVNMELAYGRCLLDRPAISMRLYCENPGHLKELAEELRAQQNAPVEGKRILAAKTYRIRILAPDQVGLMAQVSRIIYDYDINMIEFAGMTHPAARAAALDYPYPENVKLIAEIKLRVDVPIHRLNEMEKVRSGIEKLGAYWKVDVMESPKMDLARVVPEPGSQSYPAAGSLKHTNGTPE